MKGQFKSPVTLPSDLSRPVKVSGPLLNVDPGADRATLVCVLVQGDPDKNESPVWVEGIGSWEKGATMWEGTVARKGRVIGQQQERALGQGEARGIAVAVVVTEEQPVAGKIVPPSIDTLTWCVNIELEEESAATYQA